MPHLKGAFIDAGAGILGGLPNIVVFQFNPDRVTRTPTLVFPPQPADGAGPRDATQQPGQPTEVVSFMLRVDASDQLAAFNPIAVGAGVLPALSAIERLMVPRPSVELDLAALSGGPQPYTNPPERLPTVLLVWGPWRILPVNVTSLSISETLYDETLNPVHAEVTVSVQVLTPSQIDRESKLARGAYEYSQGVKEAMAALNLANAAEIGVNPTLTGVL